MDAQFLFFGAFMLTVFLIWEMFLKGNLRIDAGPPSITFWELRSFFTTGDTHVERMPNMSMRGTGSTFGVEIHNADQSRRVEYLTYPENESRPEIITIRQIDRSEMIIRLREQMITTVEYGNTIKPSSSLTDHEKRIATELADRVRKIAESNL